MTNTDQLQTLTQIVCTFFLAKRCKHKMIKAFLSKLCELGRFNALYYTMISA